MDGHQRIIKVIVCVMFVGHVDKRNLGPCPWAEGFSSSWPNHDYTKFFHQVGTHSVVYMP